MIVSLTDLIRDWLEEEKLPILCKPGGILIAPNKEIVGIVYESYTVHRGLHHLEMLNAADPDFFDKLRVYLTTY